MFDEICFEVSPVSALTFIGLSHSADASGESSIMPMLGEINLTPTELDLAIDELEKVGRIATRMRQVPIAGFPGGKVVYGYAWTARIINFQPPERLSRLSPDAWSAARRYVFERDAFICGYCGGLGGDLECDHVIPLSKGGTNEVGNLVTACKSCNREKRAKLLHEWKIENRQPAKVVI